MSHLKEIFSQALADHSIIGLVIGTRPDCIDTEKINYFRELSQKHFLSIEYGIESCYNQTLEKINRGHTFEEACQAIQMTAEAGIHTGAHLIFGLPGESPEMMLQEARIISQLPLSSVKFHQLQIVKGTLMEKWYAQDPSPFHSFSLEEYMEFVIDFMERLNPAFLVERFAGEMPPRFTSGPGWGRIRNEQIVSLVEKRLAERQTWQGRLFD